MGNDHACRIHGIGSVRICMDSGMVIRLIDVRHIPDVTSNLISLGTLEARGCEYMARDGYLDVLEEGTVIMRAKRVDSLYLLEGKTIAGTVQVASSPAELTRLWHTRLGHMGKKAMDILRKKNLLPLMQVQLDFCEHCVYGKSTRSPFGTGVHSSTRVLQYIHSDMWGPSPISSHSGNLYYVSFIDDYSRFIWLYFMRSTSEVLVIFKA